MKDAELPAGHPREKAQDIAMHHGTMIEELIRAVSRAEAHASMPRSAAGAETRPNIEETLFGRPLPLPAAEPQRRVLYLQPMGAA